MESGAELRMKDTHVSGQRCGRSLAVSRRGVEISVEDKENTH